MTMNEGNSRRRLKLIAARGAIALTIALGVLFVAEPAAKSVSRGSEAAAQVHQPDRAIQRKHIQRRMIRDRHRQNVRKMRRNRVIARRLAVNAVQRSRQGLRIRRGELLGLELTKSRRVQLEERGFTIIRTRTFDGIGLTLSVIATPDKLDAEEALALLREEDPEGVYALNHLYSRSDGADGTEIVAISDVSPAAAQNPNSEISIGLIDTGVDGTHPAFAETDLVQKNFGRHNDIVPQDHGAAVASILSRDIQAAGFRSEIYVADIYAGSEGSWGDALSIFYALDWLADENVAVINMSLAGPPNVILEKAVRATTDRGHTIIAAAGNMGPDHPPLYPAAYPDVIAVTAVDTAGGIYPQANQGAQIDFAALGVDVPAASGDGESLYTGTSFAAPHVAARAALLTPQGGTVYDQLIASAVDLGAPGRDPVYGHGVVSAVISEERSVNNTVAAQ
ncbi:MAG: S8 family serine peptidase [Pseudomonadota bacterium]